MVEKLSNHSLERLLTEIYSRLCTHFKKVFTHEHALFSIQELRKHERDGDDLPGSTEQSGFKGHPECGFCKERFYSSDELYQHCRHSHETCVICDRRSFSRSQQYYLDADALALHYQKEHYSCTERECVEKKVVVFESQEELNAHMLEVHPNALSKSAKRDARKINIVPYDSFPQGHGHGRGRGRDPNANIPPQRSEQPLRRDELAYQRTLAVQSSQSTTTRNFGGQLTAQLVPPPVPRAAAQPQRPAAGPKPGTSQPAQAQRSGPSVQPIPPPAPRTPPIIRAQPSVAPSPSHFPPLSASSQFPPLSGTQTRLGKAISIIWAICMKLMIFQTLSRPKGRLLSHSNLLKKRRRRSCPHLEALRSFFL